MKKEHVYFLSAIGVLLSPFVFLWLRGIPVAYYHGPHDESFYAYVVVKLVLLSIFIFFVFIFISLSETLFKKRVYRAVFILGILLAFYALIFSVESREETVRKECLFRYVSKCGSVKMTEDEILQELNGLQNDFGLSKRKAKKLFLEAQRENQEYYTLYANKGEESLTSEEMRMKLVHEDEIPYFERALKAVEKMNDSSWLSL